MVRAHGDDRRRQQRSYRHAPAGAEGPPGPEGPAGPPGPPGTGTHADPPCFDNANRYIDCGNGTVTDTVTGLIWLKNANCFGIKDYAAANQAAAGLASGQCGLTDDSSTGDWRLPTRAEWEATIALGVALGCEAGGPPGPIGPPPLTNDAGTACLIAGPTSFTGVQASGVQSSYYWSSTAREDFPTDLAWIANLWWANVGDGPKSLVIAFVWPVRGGR